MSKSKFRVSNSGVSKLCFELISPNGTVIAVFRTAARAEAAANTMNAM